MQAIMDAVGAVVRSALSWAGGYLTLFVELDTSGTTPVITGITALGLFCVVLPLVGLGIGIIRRLVRIRA